LPGGLAAGDHQVQDQPGAALEAEGDAFADAAEVGDGVPFDGADRGVDGAQQERAEDADGVQAAAFDVAVEGLDVDRDVGQFGHAGYSTVLASMPSPCTLQPYAS